MNDEHGGNGSAVAGQRGIPPEALLDLSSNTFLACADLTATLIARPYAFAQYPDPWAARFGAAVAAHEGLPPSQVLPGAGAAELIWLAFTALRPRHVLLLGPMFSEYVRACAALDIPYTLLTPPANSGFEPDRETLRALRESEADMAVICLPNNPGTAVCADRAELFAALGARLILVDLSYRDFLYGTPLTVEYRSLAQVCLPGARLICLHSLTKFFCCPGIRLGYALADAELVGRLRAVQPPWMLPDFAERAGEAMLAGIAAYRERLPALRGHVRHLAKALAASGLFEPERVFPGPSFVTARLRDGLSAAAVRDRLLERGVLVRVCDTIPGMPPGFLRMQARDPEALRPLHEALAALCAGRV